MDNIHVISSIIILTRDNQADGKALVEDPDLTPGLEDPPGQPQLLEGEAGGQQEGRQEEIGGHGTACRAGRTEIWLNFRLTKVTGILSDLELQFWLPKTHS